MPEMNGYHLVLKVRDNPATREIPFIFVSALTTLEEMRQGIPWMNKYTHSYIRTVVR
jgi:putative two-component system response regulator